MSVVVHVSNVTSQPFHFAEQVWIYTRQRKPSKTVLKRAYKSLKILGLNGWKLKKADQSCGKENKIQENHTFNSAEKKEENMKNFLMFD